MSLPSIEVNGVDPAGDEPPDELFYRPSEGVEMSLCRLSPRSPSPWRLAVYRGGATETEADFDDFGAGFAMLTSWVSTHRPDVKNSGQRPGSGDSHD